VVTVARYAFLVLSWLFLAGVVVQTFLAGLALFGDQNFSLHVDVGWILHLAPILVLVAAALARPGRRVVLLALALAVVVFITPLLPMLRETTPAAAALHPVFALLTFGLSVVVAQSAWRVAREPAEGRLEPAAGQG
jgi:mercuric ion transport protein